MKIFSVLKESIILVAKQPKVFIPKLLTTLLYSFYTLWAADLALRVYELPGKTPEEASLLLSEALLLFAVALTLYFIDLISYAMYPSIVTAYNDKKPVRLFQSLLDSLKAWKVILVLGIVIQILLIIVMVITFILQITTLWLSNTMILAFALPIMLIGILIFSIVVFFVMPIAILEKRSIIESFKESFSLGIKHKKDLLKVNALFLILAAVTLGTGLALEFKGVAAVIAIALFMIVRLLQAAVYTYMSVVNPYLYIRIKQES